MMFRLLASKIVYQNLLITFCFASKASITNKNVGALLKCTFFVISLATSYRETSRWKIHCDRFPLVPAVSKTHSNCQQTLLNIPRSRDCHRSNPCDIRRVFFSDDVNAPTTKRSPRKSFQLIEFPSNFPPISVIAHCTDLMSPSKTDGTQLHLHSGGLAPLLRRNTLWTPRCRQISFDKMCNS